MMECRRRASWSSSHVTGVAAAVVDEKPVGARTTRSELDPVAVVWCGDVELAVVEVVPAGVKVLPVLTSPEKHQRWRPCTAPFVSISGDGNSPTSTLPAARRFADRIAAAAIRQGVD
ncbi:UDP-N-acetylmuramoylalanine--D-glutamate ligase [Striga asiatica]|uniref:UDP-N-acetylmuramoylalanine--D-glutamate ligase n=1 Tax=Striga asiatica TaxID=4170 RepID=A0A5A7Q2M5_STRAF|nr:UDP-N-acetylmuramoylalanine--D-glutamate ligase [Striga asiatica]